tara:strand:+ start:269 stop:439 length:171 start_codon:yes stop_codon:yes gene_type:complete
VYQLLLLESLLPVFERAALPLPGELFAPLLLPALLSVDLSDDAPALDEPVADDPLV